MVIDRDGADREISGGAHKYARYEPEAGAQRVPQSSPPDVALLGGGSMLHGATIGGCRMSRIEGP